MNLVLYMYENDREKLRAKLQAELNDPVKRTRAIKDYLEDVYTKMEAEMEEALSDPKERTRFINEYVEKLFEEEKEDEPESN